MAAMPNPICHFEIGCRNSAATLEFYSKLFDWSIHEEGPMARIKTSHAAHGDPRIVDHHCSSRSKVCARERYR
jgi:predicted enzyme related to lactoylglutathione lyase